MGKGYKRKTRWRTLDIGAPPDEGGYPSDYASAVSKSKRDDSSTSAESRSRKDDSSASTVSRSRKDGSGASPSQPKIIFNENEYTRITTPRQDVLFKKGYLSRKKMWASTVSTSATPSTTESQSASHSTADGSETTEDQQLLDSKENGAEEYLPVMEPDPQVVYGTFYDHASGYYYEYPVVVGPGPAMPGGLPMHNVLSTVPCGPVPLRPIKWVNPALIPAVGTEQYCVMDYQTTQMGQYPTLVDENGVPLTEQPENYTNSSDEAYQENGTGSASWAGSVADEEQSTNNQYEAGEASVNSEAYSETALAHQLHVTHVAVPPVPEPYAYPGHFMFGPSLINVNGVTIQSGPIMQDPGIIAGPTNSGGWAKRMKKGRRRWRRANYWTNDGNEEDEEHEVAENGKVQGASGSTSDEVSAGAATASLAGEKTVATTTSTGRSLDPECQEFRPIQAPPIVSPATVDTKSSPEKRASQRKSSSPISSNSNETEKEERHPRSEELRETPSNPESRLEDEANHEKPKNARIIAKKPETPLEKEAETMKEAVPVEFASEMLANVTIMAERALAPRSVVEGTPMETEVGLDVTSVNFQEYLASPDTPKKLEEITRNGESRLHEVIAKDEEKVPNGVGEREISEKKSPSSENGDVSGEQTNSRDPESTENRTVRSASSEMINRTTTPINANSQRLPESYESLITRSVNNTSLAVPGVNSSQQQTRNRKYSSKTPKFVREATPGPDLDAFPTSSLPVPASPTTCDTSTNSIDTSATTTTTTTRNDKAENNVNKSEKSLRIPSSSAENGEDDSAIAMGVEAVEAEMRRYSLVAGEESWKKNNGIDNARLANDGGRHEGKKIPSSEHPITDAVTEWLQRANSPELFVTRGTVFDNELEDDELEIEEPPKNLQGNPMPALSVNKSSVNELSRFADFGQFASVIDSMKKEQEPSESTEEKDKTRGNVKNEMNDLETKIPKGNASLTSKERREIIARTTGSSYSVEETNFDGESDAKNVAASAIAKTAAEKLSVNREKHEDDEACKLTKEDSVAGMRVAKSSRTHENHKMDVEENAETHKSQRIQKSRRSKKNEKKKKARRSLDRDTPIENVDVKMRRQNSGEENNDEGIVEDEDISVSRTYEKGRIVVSIEGKVLPVDTYQPILLRKEPETPEIPCEEIDEGPKFRIITCEKSRIGSTGDESSESEVSQSKRNSLGSIEEPDVLECWEVETVEPIATPKKLQNHGTCLDGEDTEDDPIPRIDRKDSASVEIVRKYYRLEAMRDSGASVTSHDSDSSGDENRLGESPPMKPEIIESMISSIRSDVTPIGGDEVNKFVEMMLEKSGIPIEEAVEVYESCYGGKQPPYLIGLDSMKYQSRSFLFGRNSERNGVVPCKAACCNIQ